MHETYKEDVYTTYRKLLLDASVPTVTGAASPTVTSANVCVRVAQIAQGGSGQVLVSNGSTVQWGSGYNGQKEEDRMNNLRVNGAVEAQEFVTTKPAFDLVHYAFEVVDLVFDGEPRANLDPSSKGVAKARLKYQQIEMIELQVGKDLKEVLTLRYASELAKITNVEKCTICVREIARYRLNRLS